MELITISVKIISPEELLRKIQQQDQFLLLDVRAQEKFQEYYIEEAGLTAVNLPKNNIFEGNESVASLPKEKEIVVTCTTGNSAKKCANILAEQDYNILVLEGGITAWKEFVKTK